MNERLRMLEQFYAAFHEGDQRRQIVVQSIGVYSDLWVLRMLEAYKRLQELDASEPTYFYALVDNDWRYGDHILAIVTTKERAEEMQRELGETGKSGEIKWYDNGTSLGIEIRKLWVTE